MWPNARKPYLGFIEADRGANWIFFGIKGFRDLQAVRPSAVDLHYALRKIDANVCPPLQNMQNQVSHAFGVGRFRSSKVPNPPGETPKLRRSDGERKCCIVFILTLRLAVILFETTPNRDSC